MGLRLLVLRQNWLRLLDSQIKIEIIRERIESNRKKNNVFLYKTHSAYYLYIILIPPPQKAYDRLIKGSRKGKKAETFQSGDRGDSEEG